MPDTVVYFADVPQRRYALRAAPQQPRPMRRGQFLPGAANADAIVERVSNVAHLDVAMRHQLRRILAVTVQEWTRK